MTAKEYLSQAYRLDQRIDSNIAEITRLREMACGISSPSWEEKVQTSRNTDAPFVRCREKLMDRVWGYTYAGDYRTVDVHIRRLREKLEPDPAQPKYILTKWGVGYYFQDEEQSAV